MNQSKYICVKCGNMNDETDEFRTTGGAFAKIFDVQQEVYYSLLYAL